MIELIDPAAGLIIASSGAVLFGTASVHKLRSWPRFIDTVTNYELVPAGLARPVAMVLPAAEATIALGLFFGFSRPYTALAGCSLLLLYAAAMFLNLARGREHLDCGCFGAGERRPIAAGMVWRNLVIAAALAIDTLPWSGRALTALDALTIGAALGALVALYSAVNRMVSLSFRDLTPNRGAGES